MSSSFIRPATARVYCWLVSDPAFDVPRVIFDGDCAFCTTSATWLAERLARKDGTDPQLIPWQFADLAAIGVTAERTQREALWVAVNGEVTGGAEAFSQWLRYRRGWTAPIGHLLALPVIRQLAAALYRVIARNRHKLPGGSPACALPPPSRH